MRVLSLNPHFDHFDFWQDRVTSILKADAKWNNRSLFEKFLTLARLCVNYDIILLYGDDRLIFLFILIHEIFRLKGKLFLQELFFDTSSFGQYGSFNLFDVKGNLRFCCLRFVVHAVDAVIVHTSKEKEIYARIFDEPLFKFKFIPYYAYEDAVTFINENDVGGEYILAIGRHRDFQCFINAMKDIDYPGVIVADKSDLEMIEMSSSDNIKVFSDLPWIEYRNAIAQSLVVVIPLYANKWQRSLGQIAMFEAVLMKKPLIVADTFQFQDYIYCDEALRYQAGKPEQLKKQIKRLISDPEFCRTMTCKAFSRILDEFGMDKYAHKLLDVFLNEF